ncbi:MAG: capsular polysaccharide biosynthesis protein [Clostridia bacterium]|nr:capsular polysaccharide biosynthesis protein [Clostridia bacterium]
MIDFHSHILPRMDDGSKDVAESLKLLTMLAEQGVKTVVATPHFYANDEPLDKFLSRRAASFEALSRAVSADMPEIRLGAEVRYYQGISRLSGLKELCIQGTNLLLLEMPSSRWTEHTAREVVDLCCRGDITVILAHVERYWFLQSRVVQDLVSGSGVLMQANAEFFNSFATRRRGLRLLDTGGIHLLGSDCHSVAHRPPRIGQAFDYVRRKRGDRFLQDILTFEDELLRGADVGNGH